MIAVDPGGVAVFKRSPHREGVAIRAQADAAEQVIRLGIAGLEIVTTYAAVTTAAASGEQQCAEKHNAPCAEQSPYLPLYLPHTRRIVFEISL